ncbi:MAG TPA: hydroxyacid dehydrogenase [Planctomycetota bacterium]|nr:hydroxyacid dehydrogenase [Planctomycetota bacterium]
MESILINGPLLPDWVSYLAKAGYETIVVPEDDPAGSRRAAPHIVGMVANAVFPIDETFFASAPRLRVVGRLGVGCDNVDIDAATKHGVRVVNTPLPVIEPVAEHAFGLLLALTRAVVSGDRSVRAGTFRKGALLPSFELAGKTLGVVGLGNTGRRVAEIGKHGFRMKIVYTDPIARPDAEHELSARRVALEELLATSDVVSLHVALGPSTRGLIDAERLALMKRGAILLNLARGPVVDEDALVHALRSGRLAGAGLDVFIEEPPPADHPLFELPNVVLTPHRGGYSSESIVGISRVAEDVLRVLRGEEPEFPVN